MRFDIITAPAAWASALVNGDESGITDPEDRAAYDAFCANLEAQNLRVVDVVRDAGGEAVEPRFTWSGWLYGSAYSGCDVLDYVVAPVRSA